MDVREFSDAPRAAHPTTYPMASPGYGKRAIPGSKSGPRAQDFAHLQPREAAIAAFLDRLPDGTDISVKGLARVMPYGQCALRTALNALQQAGHLRRGREHRVLPTGARWVTRTWFSRTARDDTWWATFVTGALPEDATDSTAAADSAVPVPVPVPPADQPHDDEAGAPLPKPEDPEETDAKPQPAAPAPTAPPAPPTPPASTPVDRPARSAAYRVLATVGRRNSAVSLSAIDCEALEDLATAWFERGATEETILRALTDGLPSVIHHPGNFIRKRLIVKLPPEPETDPAAGRGATHADRRPLRILECADCRAPGSPEALRGGKCGPCRGDEQPVRQPGALPPDRVNARAAEARAAAFPSGRRQLAPSR